MKSKAQKTAELKNLKSKLPDSTITVFTTFSKPGEKGLSVGQMQTLKRSIRPLEGEYLVTKKTLIDRAVKDYAKEKVDVYAMDGSVGLVVGKGDAYAIAKKLYEFAKTNPALNFWGGIFEGKLMNREGFLEMARMPSKEILIGRLLGMLTYPVRGLAVSLDQIAKNKNN
jgi:large subunit ribosomal protein L10